MFLWARLDTKVRVLCFHSRRQRKVCREPVLEVCYLDLTPPNLWFTLSEFMFILQLQCCWQRKNLNSNKNCRFFKQTWPPLLQLQSCCLALNRFRLRHWAVKMSFLTFSPINYWFTSLSDWQSSAAQRVQDSTSQQTNALGHCKHEFPESKVPVKHTEDF